MSQAQLIPEAFSPSVSLHYGRPATTSLEVAKFFGKQHQHVMRSIDDLRSNTPESFSASNFGRAEYSDEQGKPRPMFILYRDGFMLLVMGYTGKKALGMKLAYIEAFNRMEAELAARQQTALSAAPGPDAPAASLPLSTTEDRKPLRALVGSWAQVAGLPFAACWNQLKAAFQLANIRELPQAWLPDALAWVQEKIDALPAPLPQAKASAAAPVAPGKPAAQAVGSVRIGASDLSARQDAMRRISKVQWQLAAAIDVMRLFCNPKAHPDQCGEMSLEMASNLYTTAHASLVSAYNALEAAERLQHGRM